MALNLSSLTKYVDEQRLPLISKLGLEAKSAGYFELMTGVKNEAALNLLGVTAPFQDGHSCGWNAQGDVTFSQRNIKVGSIKVESSICQNAMQEYWMNYEVQVAAGRKNLPFEEEISSKIIDAINEHVETAIWQGTVANDKFDGLLTILAGEQGVNVVTEAQNATAYDNVKAVYNAIPSKVLSKARIFVNIALFRDLVQELVAKNLFHYDPKIDESMEIVLPGTSTKVTAVAGLEGAKKIVALVPEHTFYGCDLQGDKEEFKIWYSEDNDEFRYRVAFVAGVQVAFPEEVTMMTYA